MSDKNVLAIIVGGGPAPGINAVISAAAIEAINNGFEVLGVQDGFKWLMREDTSHVRPLRIEDVSRIHLQGGSVLGTARDNPTKSEQATQTVVKTLRSLGVNHLVTIGGDDTALSSSYVAEHSGHEIKVVHVPKTIDNDLPLPPHIPTFGYQTARHVGVELVQNLLEDARSTKRWFVVVAMGRKAGFLALGVGKAAGATLTVIGEEFEGREAVPFSEICDIVEGAIIKRRAVGKRYGLAVLAEGLIEKLDPAELAGLQEAERDEHGHIRFSEIDLGRKVKDEVQRRLAARGLRVTVINKNIGYELRCADPIPFDAAYCRDLGYAAICFLRDGGSDAMVSIQGGRMVPIAFADIREPETGRTRVRMVNVESEGYRVAREYMTRLEPGDFRDASWVEKLARAGNMTAEAFRERFGYLSGNTTA
ncbi:MAG TPA: diphosphate--fructose-6-phosphate 1-phosphotransferase [Pyrinomonadaceae bacterium]|nr:diphosphate--fructose-6-phosphate 1-phosphotransferase [Pyrinomonadaceae bacterium]